MAFFNPALLWFALGGSIPIIIHLLHRQKFRRVRWAAMEWLLAALKKTQRRLRIENLILLLLRILIMIILALAIARPFLREATALTSQDTDVHYIVAIDNSYSMGYKKAQLSSLDMARKAAEQVLTQIKPSELDRFTLLLASEYPERPMKERNRIDQIKGALSDIKPSHYGSDMQRTFLEIQDALSATKNQDRRVYLFTDLQRNGWLQRDETRSKSFRDLLKTISQHERTRIYIIDVGTPSPVNHSIVDIRVSDPVVTTKRPADIIVDVFNYSPTPVKEMRVTLYIDDNFYQEKVIVLPPGTLMPANFRYDFAEPGPHIIKATLATDFLDVDDSRWLAVDVKLAVKGLLIDGEPGPKRFLNETGTLALALDLYQDGRHGISAEVRPWDNFSVDNLDAYDFLVLANVKAVAPEKLEKIEQWVQRGGGLFITMGDQVNIRPFNDSFYKGGDGLSPASLVEMLGQHPKTHPPGAARRIQNFNKGHPTFRTFNKQLEAAVSDIVFFNYMKVDNVKPERVVAYLDDGNKGPLLVEKKFGEGKVILYTCSIDDEWNDGFPGKPPYLPIVRNLCEYLASRPFSRRNFMVGDLIQLTLPAEMWQKIYILETPQEGAVTLSPTPPEGDSKIFELHYPAKAKADDPHILINEGLRHAGKYTLSRQAPKEGERAVAFFGCNLPPRVPSPEELQFCEGNLDRTSPDEFGRLFPEFRVEFLGEKSEQSQEIELAPPASGLWKYLLYLLVAFVCLETVLAWLFGRSKQ